MSSEYEEHRQRQLAAARDSFNEFLAGLKPKQRAILKGVGAPEDDTEMANGRDKDVAELPVASYSVDMANEVDSFTDILGETFAIDAKKARVLAEWMEHEIAQRAMSYRASDIN